MKNLNILVSSMKRMYILISLSLVCLRSPAQEAHFQVKFSEPLAVFQFLDYLSANAPQNVFKTAYDKSPYNVDKYTRLITEYDQLDLDYGYEYTAYPYAQKIGGSTASLLKRNLVNSSSINEFKLASLGIIPNADLFKLCELLTAFEPVYQTLVYQPCKEKFDRQLSAISSFADSGKLSRFFDIGLKFYHSSWDEQTPFIIALYPLAGALHFTATAFYNNAEVAVPVDLQDDDKLLSVMIHEIFHILYDEESIDFKKNIENAFKNNPSRGSRYAYLLLNEALATTLGNGYVYGQLKGVEDTGAWYRRVYTNLMAKAIYPLVKTYITEGKSLDKDFIDHYIQIFDRNFAGWLRKKDFIMADRYVIADNPDSLNLVDQLYPYRSMSAYEPEITTAAIEKMRRAPITKIAIVSKHNKQVLDLIKKEFNELRDWQPDSRTNFSYAVFLADKTYLIILNNVTGNTADQLERLTLQ
jgi:hypothetical protein